MDRHTDLVIDPRSEGDIRREIARLAASYTPEWCFDPENPDIGSTIALIFAAQMAGNISRLNQVIGKYHTEFVNLLGLSLLPAYPASGVAVLSLIPDTVAGLPLPKGTKLLGEQAGEEPIVFETLGDVYLTNTRLTDILSISSYFGKIIPLLGGPRQVQILPGPAPEQQENPIAGTISLFDFTRPGVARSAAVFYHQTVFDTGPGVHIQLSLTGTADQAPVECLADPDRFRWSYRTAEGLTPFDRVALQEGILTLDKAGESEPLSLDGVPYDLICVESLEPVSEPLSLAKIGLASTCEGAEPSFLCHNDQDLEAGRFLPFGDTASLFDDCYLGHDRIFSQRGALVTLHFTLSFQERLVTFTPQQEAGTLKIIKRKPKAIPFETAATAPQTVSFDYFNGLGWRRLPTLQDWSTLFDGEHPGKISLSFRCPDDWLPTVVGGYDQRCIRIRITRADNCYLQPCVHTMPVVEGLTLTYRYDQGWKLPQLVQSIQGTQIFDFTADLLAGSPVTLFQPLPYPGNALYLGFDQRPAGAPVSLLFDVAEPVHFQSAPISFEYTSFSGWKPLKVIDNTNHMTSAGTVLFMPPADMAPVSVEGITRYWLRLVDADNIYVDQERHHPLIRAILPNAVEIRNVETLEPESFYLTVPGPNMTFPIAAENILSAEVFVNERDRLSLPMMQQLLRERPEDVRATYNFLGDIVEFFVRWHEVENFDTSTPSDRHYTIDRMNNTISFGDGVHVRIPTARNAVAFTVQASCCKGAKGNLPTGAVNALRGRMLYIDSVYNPIATYAGSDLEHLSSAQRRGANLLCSRGRLVSQVDFYREVAAFSDAIAKVKCLTGVDLDGRREPALVTIAVMMKDYASGSYSFHSLKDRLRQRLLSRCEATLDPGRLILSEPIYVSISLTVWAETADAHRAFELQTLIQQAIDEFLDPMGQNGWDIGVLPTRAQLRMLLHALRGPGQVKRFLATARYVDPAGVHERSLEELPYSPFAIGIPGTHKVYLELPQ
ncbi:MAG: hypothetical protein HFE97_11310 [Oscillospiraceae bacterium]|nr:hypothetical protein [Oscillospiraceae bacterium]